MADEQCKRRLLGGLFQAGVSNLKLSKRQEMKLKEWIIPYTIEELDLEISTEPLKIADIRKFIDRWEHPDLSPEKYNYYYVEKDTNGKSLWDLI